MRLVHFVTALWEVVRRATPGDGRGLEHDVRELLVSSRLRSDHVPGGYSMLGIGSASGLWHQLDLEAHLDDAIVAGELKAHRRHLPKGELLHFVAATDDLYVGAARRYGRIPTVRAIAGTFSISEAARTYAALKGVLVIDPYTVPAPLLAIPGWTASADYDPLVDSEREAVASLVRPIRTVLDEGARWARRGDASRYRFGIRTQLQWSLRALGPASPVPVTPLEKDGALAVAVA